jgi:hypothetical protein
MSSQPTRRNRPTASLSSTYIDSPQPSSSAMPSSSNNNNKSRSSIQPTPSETVLLLLFPAILLTGSIFSTINPTTHSTPYSVASQSHPPDLAPSYFARKSNILNIYFVKILWVWITGAFGLFLITHPLTGPTATSRTGFELSVRRLQALVRYLVVTVWWIAVTQWFFGPALIDRSFRLTGGKCEMVAAGELSDSPTKEFFAAAACKAAGGAWVGGHDISGHVFILILGSAFLVLEAMPVFEVVLQRGWAAIEERKVEEQRKRSGEFVVLAEEGDAREWGYVMTLVCTVVGTALWMLLMTATYFHTWFEKVWFYLFFFLSS